MRADDANPGSEYDTQETEMFIRSDGDNDEASVSMKELALADSEWISPPVSIRSASADASTEVGLADSFGGLDVTEPISGGSGSHGKRDDSNFFCSSGAEVLESLHGKTDLDNNQVIDTMLSVMMI